MISLFIVFGVVAIGQGIIGIYVGRILQNAEVQVVACRSACGTYVSDNVPCLNRITLFYLEGGAGAVSVITVAVKCRDSVTVIYNYAVTEAAIPTCTGYHTAFYSENGCSAGSGNINAVMDGDLDGFINAYLKAKSQGKI